MRNEQEQRMQEAIELAVQNVLTGQGGHSVLLSYVMVKLSEEAAIWLL